MHHHISNNLNQIQLHGLIYGTIIKQAKFLRRFEHAILKKYNRNMGRWLWFLQLCIGLLNILMFLNAVGKYLINITLMRFI